MILTTLYYSTLPLSWTSTHGLVDIHNTRRTRLKLSDDQRLASPHRPRKLPKPTLATAKHSVLRRCIPRYALALESASKPLIQAYLRRLDHVLIVTHNRKT